VVGGKGFSSRSVGIAHYQNVVNTIGTRTEGVLEHSAGTNDDFGIITRGLAGGATIVVPLGQGREGGSLEYDNIFKMGKGKNLELEQRETKT
jgi:hypothetical protein